jgi:hypothetical protein
MTAFAPGKQLLTTLKKPSKDAIISLSIKALDYAKHQVTKYFMASNVAPDIAMKVSMMNSLTFS